MHCSFRNSEKEGQNVHSYYSVWHIYYANIICKKSRNHLQNATSTTWTAYKLQDLQIYTNHISVWPTKKTTKKATPSNSLHKNTRTQGEPWIIDGHVSPQRERKRVSAGEARRGFPEDSAGKSRGVFFPWRKWWILQCWNDIWYILRTIRWFLNRLVETKQIRIWNVMFSFTFRNYGQLDELIGNSSRVKSGGFSYLHFVVSWKLDFQFCGFFGWLLGTVSNNSVMSNKTKERAGLNMYKYGICNCSDLFWWSLLLSLDGFSTNVPTRVYPQLNIPPRFLIRSFHWFPKLFQGFMFKHVFFSQRKGVVSYFTCISHVVIWHLKQKSTWEVSKKILLSFLSLGQLHDSSQDPCGKWKKHHLFLFPPSHWIPPHLDWMPEGLRSRCDLLVCFLCDKTDNLFGEGNVPLKTAWEHENANEMILFQHITCLFD